MERIVLNENINIISKREEYKVFVAGIPSSLNYTSIKQYFSIIGPITGIEMIDRGKVQKIDHDPRLLDQPCYKGFCVITTPNKITFNRIMTEKNFLLGRLLICNKYLKNEDLLRHNKKINQQRILLKRVPGFFNENQLKDFLEKRYGNIKIIYAFKTQIAKGNTIIENARKSFVTYSVTFESQKSANLLIGMKEIYGPGGYPIQVLPFQYYSKDIEADFKEPHRVEDSKKEVTPIRKKRNEEDSIRKAPSIKVKKTVERQDPRESNYLIPTSRDVDKRFNIPISIDCPSTQVEISSPINKDHSIKPTTKVYHTTKSSKIKVSQDQDCFRFNKKQNDFRRLINHEFSNLTFNVLARRPQTEAHPRDVQPIE